MNHIEVYYDGVNIDKFYDNPNVKGFTTNISFLKAAGISDYHSFITNSLKYIQGRPISFQLYDDTDEDIESTAKIISSYDTEHIFVKIPVIKTNTESNANIIQKLHNESIKINVTAIFTKEQIDSIRNCFDKTTDVIVSIFAGRINDSGLDCSDVVKHAVETFKDYPNIKILWAACRTVYNMFEAENQGAHIVTVPDTVLSRMNRIGDDTHEASVQQVKQFMKDGIDGNIKFPYWIRTTCVICNNDLFEDVYKKEYPIQFTPPTLTSSVNEDNVELLYFIGCKTCGCVQIKYLIDPIKLYGNAHNVTYNYPSMRNHHNKFAEFISKNIINTKIIEVGGSNGILASILKENFDSIEKNIEYTIIDLCDRVPENNNITYINANCETYCFPENNTIILSHVYEHLYNPFKFTKNLKDNNVNQVIIANPDFVGLLKRNDSSFLNFEHTFFCPTVYLDYIMNENRYYRNDILNHEGWAIFYSYIKCDKITDSNENKLNLKNNIHYIDELKNYLVERENKYKNLEIDNENKTFIFPAGHYGQLAYYFLNDNIKKNIEGFIDGDKFKIGKRVYGTKYYTFEKCEISKYENVNIIICSERYRNEMIDEIKLLNKNAKIINL